MPISSQVSDMLPHYHDTLMLLKKYRDIAWIVEVSSRNLQEEFRAEYGCPGRDVLNSLALNKTDASLMDCSQSLEHSAKMLHIIDSAVDLIREKHKKGELYYWILYYAYLSPHKYENSSEILRALESKAPPISLRTYYARREEAIELLSSVLWAISLLSKYRTESAQAKPYILHSLSATIYLSTKQFTYFIKGVYFCRRSLQIIHPLIPRLSQPSKTRRLTLPT